MPLHNSSTSNSKQSVGFATQSLRRKFLATLVWTVIATVCLDGVVGWIFRLPANPKTPPTSIQAYFDYGRSIEGKLRRMVGLNVDQDAPIIDSGWIGSECNQKSSIISGKFGIEIYGNSFSAGIAREMQSIDPGVSIQGFGGPAAPLSHSYACFISRAESVPAHAKTQIIGILGSSMRRMLTVSGLTTSFEQPQPFTYPRITLDADGEPVLRWPSIRDAEEFRSALADRIKWEAFLSELSEMDSFYAPELFFAEALDHSVFLRLLRRAWGQRFLRNHTAALNAENGFSGAPEIVLVTRAILVDFAKRARAAGERPVVILIEDQGFGGLLSTILSATLRQNHIEFIATGEIVRTDDPGNFVQDGHFTSAAYSKIAHSMLRLLGRPS